MAAYTEIEINGLKVGIRFGLHAIKRISEKVVLAKDMAADEQNLFFVKQVLYSGYLNDCLAKDIIPSLKPEDFHEFIEKSAFEQNMSSIQDAMKVYSESVYIKPKEEPRTEMAEVAKEEKKTSRLAGS